MASSWVDLAEIEYNVYKYVLISVLSHDNKNPFFVNLEWALYIYIGSWFDSTEPAVQLYSNPERTNG